MADTEQEVVAKIVAYLNNYAILALDESGGWHRVARYNALRNAAREIQSGAWKDTNDANPA